MSAVNCLHNGTRMNCLIFAVVINFGCLSIRGKSHFGLNNDKNSTCSNIVLWIVVEKRVQQHLHWNGGFRISVDVSKVFAWKMLFLLSKMLQKWICFYLHHILVEFFFEKLKNRNWKRFRFYQIFKTNKSPPFLRMK